MFGGDWEGGVDGGVGWVRWVGMGWVWVGLD